MYNCQESGEIDQFLLPVCNLPITRTIQPVLSLLANYVTTLHINILFSYSMLLVCSSAFFVHFLCLKQMHRIIEVIPTATTAKLATAGGTVMINKLWSGFSA